MFINVTPVNDTPTIVQAPVTLPEDSLITFCPTINDIDNGDILTVSICGGPTNGTATVTANCITYTPAPNFNGQDTICLIVCDQAGACDTTIVPITVTPRNDAPIAVNDTITTQEGSPIIIGVLNNDSDIDTTLNPASVAVIGGPSNGSISVNPTTGAITYTPTGNFNGQDSFTYVVCDNGIPLPALCDTATVFINVTPVNDTPTIVQAPVTLPEDSTITFCPTVNDIDNGDVLTVSLCGGPNNGNASIAANCITYTPTSNYNGQDTLCVIVCDQTGACDTVIVPITVTPMNDAPIAVNDSVNVNENDSVLIVVLINDSDIDGQLDSSSVTIIGGPFNGTATVDPITGVVNYVPNPNFNGVDSFTYVICDNGTPLPSQCDTAVVYINIIPCLNNPAADCDGDGVSNGSEIANGTNPSDPCSYTASSVTLTPSSSWNTLDCDGDGVTNGTEITDNTDPQDPCDYVTASQTLATSAAWAILDCDGDGVTNSTEVNNGTNPQDPCNYFPASVTLVPTLAWTSVDCDGDGVINGTEVTEGTDPLDPCDFVLASATLATSTTWNNTDCDGDGVINSTEVSDSTNPLDPCEFVLTSITLTADTAWTNADCDGDGVTNGTELSEGTNPLDPCSFDLTSVTLSPDSTWLNTDCDGDGVINGTEVSDSTNPSDPCNYNPSSVTLVTGSAWNNADCDGDGVLNATEVSDSTNPLDPCDFVLASMTLNPSSSFNAADCDGDGVSNGDEIAGGTDPLDPCSYEVLAVTITQGGDWLGVDCDGDGVINGEEVADSTNPLDPCSFVLASQSVTPTPAWNDLDCDNDGFTNGIEITQGSNPLDSCDPKTCNLIIPEGFSPNGDGVNDVFEIVGIDGYPGNEIKIFNRWGNLVFEAKPYTNTWDGTSNFGLRIGGDELPSGVYFYILDLGDGTKPIRGYVHLKRED